MRHEAIVEDLIWELIALNNKFFIKNYIKALNTNKKQRIHSSFPLLSSCRFNAVVKRNSFAWITKYFLSSFAIREWFKTPLELKLDEVGEKEMRRVGKIMSSLTRQSQTKSKKAETSHPLPPPPQLTSPTKKVEPCIKVFLKMRYFFTKTFLCLVYFHFLVVSPFQPCSPLFLLWTLTKNIVSLSHFQAHGWEANINLSGSTVTSSIVCQLQGLRPQTLYTIRLVAYVVEAFFGHCLTAPQAETFTIIKHTTHIFLFLFQSPFGQNRISSTFFGN